MASAFFRERALNQPILLLRSTLRGRNGYLSSQAWLRPHHKGAAMQSCSLSRNYLSKMLGSSSNNFYSKHNHINGSSNVLERHNRHSMYARSNILLLGSHHRGKLATLSARGYSTAMASQADENSPQHLQHHNILPADTPLQLSNEQRYLLRKVIEDKKSVFFTGSAGTGKSVLLRQLIQDLRQVYKPGQVAVTASTGIAACNIGGCTLHSFAGVGLASGTVEQLMVKLDEKKRNKARWRKTKVLIIDEISMVDGALFDKLEEIARRVKKNDKPFGGIQLIVTGDFFQLPPVANTSHTLQDPTMSPIIFPPSPARASLSGSRSTSTIVQRDSADYLDHQDEVPYFEGEFSAPLPTADAAAALTPEVQQQTPLLCFDAKSWKTCIEYTLQLTEVFRQRDQRFINMLTEMRHGKLSDETCRIFKELERTPQYPDDGIQATELFALRREVETANHRHLADLAGPVYVYQPRDHGPWKEVMDRVCIAPTRLQLKENAQVMLIKNLTPTLVNGSMGVVVGFQKDNTVDMETGELVTSHFPVVRFVGEEDDLVIRPEEWKLELPDGEVLGSRIQVPLILSWAMSIHKSQGQTIERLKVDMGKIFEAGQAYVAISRATTLEGLQVVNFNKRSVLAHDRVGAFYDGLVSVQELMNLEKQVVQEQLKLGGKRRRSKKNLKVIEAAAYETLTASRTKQVKETLTEDSGIENQKAQQEPIWREDVEELSLPVTAASLLSAPTTLVPSSPPAPPVTSTKAVPSSPLSTFKATEAVLTTSMGAPVKASSVSYNTSRKSKPVSSKASTSSSWPTPKWLQQSPSASSSMPESLSATATRPTRSNPLPLKSTSSVRPWYSGSKSAPSTAAAAITSSTASIPATTPHPSASKTATTPPKSYQPSSIDNPRQEVSVVPAAEAPSTFIPPAARKTYETKKPVPFTGSRATSTGRGASRDTRSVIARSGVTRTNISSSASSSPVYSEGKTTLTTFKNAPATQASSSTSTSATASQWTGSKPRSGSIRSQSPATAARTAPRSPPRGLAPSPSSSATTKSREQSAPWNEGTVVSQSRQRTTFIVPARRR